MAVRRRAVQLVPSANLAALAMVPASVLLGSELPTDTVCLDGSRDPNTVLARLRSAAAAPGPLLVYLSGRLTADRRGRRLYFALAGTTASAVRYTAVPWEWLGGELRARPAGLTTVLLDLAADRDAWPLLREYGSLPVSPCADVYGVVCPPGFGAGDGLVSGYTRQWIDQLRRSPVRPSDVQLHALAAGAAGLPPGALVLPTARELGMRPGPRPQQLPEQPPGQHAESWSKEGEYLPGRPVPHSASRSGSAPVRVPDAGPARDVVPGVIPGVMPVGDAAVVPAAVTGGDPRPYIHALASEGRHGEAAALAGAWEEYVRGVYGGSSSQAVEWAEIRADLARMAGDFALAARLWMGACRVRLAGQGRGEPEVLAAAAGALYCWTRLGEREAVVEVGVELVAVLRELPGLDPRYLELARARLSAWEESGLPRPVRT
ncbi:hypothetical protein [Streptomyces avidinii]|uniref:Uncharacterized protein n=1 Tax=Streptomyces avidinii TaxID=1895 RepID=A0ABS4LFU6_STRAV|nr:hypothetical protein [Streptomyces avidinii]MBP2040978.1 hypothetical protein [Streptomyces avidinii]